MKSTKRKMTIVDFIKLDFNQIVAVVIKDSILHFRQWKSNFFQIITPIICMFFIFILQIILDEIIIPSVAQDTLTTRQIVPTFPMTLPISQLFVGIQNSTVPDKVLLSYSPEYEELFYNSSDNKVATLLNLFNSQFEPKRNLTNPENAVDEQLFSSLEEMADNPLYSFPYLGALKISKFEENSLDYTIQYETKEGGAISSFSTNGRLSGKTPFCQSIGVLAGGSHCEFIQSTYLMDLIHYSFMNKFVNNTRISFSLTQQMPFYLDPKSLVDSFADITQLIGRIIYPLLLLLPFPSIIYSFVYEKEKKLKEMMKLMGLRERNFLIASFIVKFVILIFSYLVFMFLGLILQHRVFIQTNFFVVSAVGVGTALMVFSLSLFFSSFLNSSYIATIFSYIFVVFTPLIGVFVNQFVLQRGRLEFKFLLVVFPFLPITECIIYLFKACDTFNCLTISSAFQNFDFLIALGFLFFDSFLFFLFSIYLEQITPKQWGVRKNPFFIFKPIYKPIIKLFKKKTDEKIIDDSNEELDDDVDAMKQRIINNELKDQEKGIVMKGLTKRFGKNIAVNNVFLNVGKTECCSLLGVNGAGKTTIIRVLCQLYKKSKGSVFVNNLNLDDFGTEIRASLGFCPQFSIVWDELTTSEHLLFYSRIKGTRLFSEDIKDKDDLLERIGFLSDSKKEHNKEIPIWKKIFYFFFPNERKTKELSGGMKRRCSIAIALVGNPSTVLLDEPTTGLDPVNRRGIWDIINREKTNKCIIFTTHSMEESDALGDRILIMKKGKLKCIGSSLHLKSKFGNGYKLTISYDPKVTSVDELLSFSHEKFLFTSVSIYSDIPGTLQLTLLPKKDQFFKISKIVKEMQLLKQSQKIFQFEINQTTLEDVFLNVLKEPKEEKEIERTINESNEENDKKEEIEEEEKNTEKGKKEEKIEDVNIKLENIIIEEDTENKEKKERNVFIVFIMDIFIYVKEVVLQVLFLLHKNMLLSIRGWKASLIQIISPLVVVILIFILSLLALLFANPEGTVHPSSSSITQNLQKCTEWNGKNCYRLAYTTNDDYFANLIMDDIVADYNLEENIDFIRFNDTFQLETYFLDSPNVTHAGISFWSINQLLNLNISEVIEYISRLGLATELFGLGSFEDLFNITQILGFNPLISNFDVFQSLNSTNFQILGEFFLENLNFLETFESFQIALQDINSTFIAEQVRIILEDPSIFIGNNTNATILEETILSLFNISFPSPVNFTVYTIYYNGTYDLTNKHLELKSIIDNRIYYFSQLEQGKKNITKEVLKGKKQPFPTIRSRAYIDGQSSIFSITGGLFFSLSTMVLFIISLYKLVQEKEIGLRSGLTMIGMKKTAYLLSWFITFVFFGVLMGVVSIISGYIFFLDPFIYSNPLFMILLFFCFSLTLVCLAFSFSVFFNKAKQALTFGFIVLGISFILNLFLSNGVIAYLLMGLEGWYSLIPLAFEILWSPFNFGKVWQDIIGKTSKIFDLQTNTYKPNVGYYSWNDFIEPNKYSVFIATLLSPPSYRSILFLLLNSVLYISVFLYFDNVIPNPSGVSQKLWYFLTPSYWGLQKYFRKKQRISMNLAKKSDEELEVLSEDLKNEYIDVRTEVQAEGKKELVLRVLNLRKTYNEHNLFAKKVKALKGIDIGIRKKEVLSYLGHNGAGKSTTQKMIAAVLAKGKGEIFINGKTIPDDIVHIRPKLGVCFQHDLLWNQLTAAEHVRIYSQIKGLRSPKKLKAEIEKRLKEVSLFDVKNKQVGTFSGGMKRRLSCSLSFCADPILITLDESSAGVDPLNRRDLWDLIRNKNRNSESAIFLTTHSMEEAQQLSTRIAILQHGEMLCIGTSLELKQKYGDGYYLRFATNEISPVEFEKIIKSEFPHIKLVTRNAGNYVFNLPSQYIDELSKGIEEIENKYLKGSENDTIKAFGLTNTTLEDVYLRVTKEGDERRRRLKDSQKGKDSIIIN